MHQETSPAYGGNSSGSSSTIQSEELGFNSLYSIFPPNPCLLTSEGSVEEEESSVHSQMLRFQHENQHSVTIQDLILQHCDLLDRHRICLTHLHDASKEVESLHLENENLWLVNRDLCRQVNALTGSASLQRRNADQDLLYASVENDFRRLSIGEKADENARAWDELNQDESPTSVIEGGNLIKENDAERVTLPKSISVRSSGYLKAAPTVGSNFTGLSHVPARPRTTSPVSRTRVYVGGGTKPQDEALELEVFNQGMFKTELCNKWQETGECPYRAHCQFAHGIKELRPVIRHPRYKTEVCRMILAGINCPYGHRCHFRHALMQQEKFMLDPTSPSAISDSHSIPA